MELLEEIKLQCADGDLWRLAMVSEEKYLEETYESLLKTREEKRRREGERDMEKWNYDRDFPSFKED